MKLNVNTLPHPLGIKLTFFYSAYHFWKGVKSYTTDSKVNFLSIKKHRKHTNYVLLELP